jgi:hypothetical protein
VRVLGLRWRDGVHHRFIPEVVSLILLLSDEDVVLLDVGWIVIFALVCRWSRLVLAVLVSLAFTHLLWRRPKQLAGALFKILDEIALTHGVGRQPARGAVELAWPVQHHLEGVFLTLAPLTAARSPQASLVSNRSFGASCVLGEHLLDVEPQVDVESWLARMSASGLGALSSLTGRGSWISMVPAMVARLLDAVISTALAWSAVAPAVLSPALVGR